MVCGHADGVYSWTVDPNPQRGSELTGVARRRGSLGARCRLVLASLTLQPGVTARFEGS